MKRLAGLLLTGTFLLSIMTGCGASIIEPTETTEAKELTFSAQDDYYGFINHETLKEMTFEKGDSEVSLSFDSEETEEQIKELIKEIVKGEGYEVGSEEYIIKAAYESYLAYDFENEPIPEKLTAAINSLNDAKNVRELIKADCKVSKDLGCLNLLNMYVIVNYFESDKNVLALSQQNYILDVSLDSLKEDYYALDNLKSTGRTVMTTLGYDQETAEGYGQDLAYFIYDLYNGTDLEILENGEQLKYAKEYTLKQIDDIFTNVDIEEYINDLGITDGYDVIGAYDEQQMRTLNSLLVDENLNALKLWRIGNLCNDYKEFLAPHYDNLSSFVKKSYDPIEDQAIEFVMNKFSKETDPIYVERYYSIETDEYLRSMCGDILEGYRSLIGGADWLTEETRDNLIQKLDNIVIVTGSNSKRHDNSEYAGLNTDNYFELILSYDQIKRDKENRSLTEPVDRNVAGITMQTVNACYDPRLNTVTITVAILKDPVFNITSDYYTNLGGLGAVIAHEIGHAFDSNGMEYDMNGCYNPEWLNSKDVEALESRNEKAKEYFSNFTVFEIYHVDPDQTLGENYADLGGMECVVSLAKTDDDLIRIFEKYASFWCVKRTDQSVIQVITYDSHSPEEIRVNAILATLDEFIRIYDVKEGDGMYIAPDKRISRWH